MPHAAPPITEWVAPGAWRAVDCISDLHLDAQHPATLRALQDYLERTRADAVLILGDLFEVWVGDDAIEEPGSFEGQVCALLRQAAARRPTGFMHGNRDFLIGNGFARATGIALLAAALLSLTNFGNWIRATGGFNEAAASMGIPVRRVKIICFMLCSMLAGFAGLLQVLRLGSPLPSIGEGLELQAVAAAVIGGTALAGGIGTVLGAIIGTLLIRTIDNGLVLSRVDANWFKFAIGLLTMFAVIANAWMAKMSRRIKVEAHK